MPFWEMIHRQMIQFLTLSYLRALQLLGCCYNEGTCTMHWRRQRKGFERQFSPRNVQQRKKHVFHTRIENALRQIKYNVVVLYSSFLSVFLFCLHFLCSLHAWKSYVWPAWLSHVHTTSLSGKIDSRLRIRWDITAVGKKNTFYSEKNPVFIRLLLYLTLSVSEVQTAPFLSQ